LLSGWPPDNSRLLPDDSQLPIIVSFAWDGMHGDLLEVFGNLKVMPSSHWGHVKAFFHWTRGGVELDPTQIVTPRVNTVERVTIAPGLCLSNFTYIVVWCVPALSAILSRLCRWAPHAHWLLARMLMA